MRKNPKYGIGIHSQKLSRKLLHTKREIQFCHKKGLKKPCYWLAELLIKSSLQCYCAAVVDVVEVGGGRRK